MVRERNRCVQSVGPEMERETPHHELHVYSTVLIMTGCRKHF